MGIDQSPLAAAMKLAQQPRRDMAKALRIGLAWITTDKGTVWHNGMTVGYRSFLGFTADRQRGVVILSNTAADAADLGVPSPGAGYFVAAPFGPIVSLIFVRDRIIDLGELALQLLAMLGPGRVAFLLGVCLVHV
jgi:hypothetical protein